MIAFIEAMRPKVRMQFDYEIKGGFRYFDMYGNRTLDDVVVEWRPITELV